MRKAEETLKYNFYTDLDTPQKIKEYVNGRRGKWGMTDEDVAYVIDRMINNPYDADKMFCSGCNKKLPANLGMFQDHDGIDEWFDEGVIHNRAFYAQEFGFVNLDEYYSCTSCYEKGNY